MTRLPRVEARRLATALRKHGFLLIAQKGSHAKFRHADGRQVTVPMHAGQVLKPRLVREILEVCKIDPREL